MRNLARVVAIFLLALGGAAQACTVTALNEGRKKLAVEANCAFQNAGSGRHNTFSGGPAIDFGNGRVAQKLITGTLCLARQNIYFLDCSTGQGLVVYGKRVGPRNEAGKSGHKTVSAIRESEAPMDLIQEPLGPLDLSSRTTLSDLRRTSQEHNYQNVSDLRWFFTKHKTRTRIDYTCGCKLYYPDSPGAKL